MSRRLRRITLLLAIAAASFSISAYPKSNQPIPGRTEVQQQQQEEHKETNTPSINKNDAAQSAPSFVNDIPPTYNQIKSANDSKKSNDESSADWWMVKLTAVLAAIGGLQLFIFGLQARRLKQTIDKMDEVASGQTTDMAAAIKESSRAATAMEVVANTLERNTSNMEAVIERQKFYANIQLRAYVFPFTCDLLEGAILDPPREDKKCTPGIIMQFKNSGNTPARHLISNMTIKITDVDQENSLAVEKLEDFAPITLAAGGVLPKTMWFYRPLTSSEIEDVEAGRKGIFVYGRIEYDDIFLEHRYTNFRLVYTNAKFPPVRPSGTFTHCQGGNDSN